MIASNPGEPIMHIKEIRVDLHVHTNLSDGLHTPEEILHLALSSGVRVLSITDHDTIDAYTDQITDLAQKLELDLIPGVEVSTRDQRGKYHILGYFADLERAEVLKSNLEKVSKNRHLLAEKICDLLVKAGFFVNPEMLRSLSSVTKAHIARLVLDNPLNRQKLLEDFDGQMPTEGRIVETYMLRGQVAYVKPMSPSPQEAINWIHRSGGIAILAHPIDNVLKGWDPSSLVDFFVSIGIDGLEAYYIQYDRSNNDTEEERITEFSNLAKSRGMLITGGSDFHHNDTNSIGRFIDLGMSNVEVSVPYQLVIELKNALEQKK